MSEFGKDLFGEDIKKEARTMSDYFGVPPFSIIDTVDSIWQARKRKWNLQIGDNGESRENTLFAANADSESDVANKLANFNNGVSILDPCLAEVCCKWFSEKGHHAFDPFAGDSVFGFVAATLGLNFTGIELREDQATVNQGRLDKAGLTGQYICDTSENMDAHIEDNSKDFIFSCPPYADLEVYSDDPRDLSTMSHTDFFTLYSKILGNTYKKLKQNRFAVVVTSEVRDKDTGFYIGLVKGTINAMEAAGYKFYNDIILVNSVGTLPLRVGKQMNSGRKVGRRHQNILVFFKGDPRKIKEHFSELIPKNQYYEK